VKTGPIAAADLRGLAELSRRWPRYRPLVVCDDESRALVERSGLTAQDWRSFLIAGPPRGT
jgi:hypothetical protein